MINTDACRPWDMIIVLRYITLLCSIHNQYRIYTTYLQQVFRFIHRQLREKEIAGTSQCGLNRPISNLNKNINHVQQSEGQSLYSTRRHRLIGIGIPVINLWRSSDRLRFIMGIPTPIRRHLYIQDRNGVRDIIALNDRRLFQKDTWRSISSDTFPILKVITIRHLKKYIMKIKATSRRRQWAKDWQER